MKHITALLAALVLVLGVHTYTRADAPAGVTKWEYKLVRDDEMMSGEGPDNRTKREAALNRLGADGWELASIMVNGVVFKRAVK